MSYQLQTGKHQPLPEELINGHLQTIFASPLFQTSDILKRFLAFIVKETLEGRANQLKEYTIGVGVLKKSTLFKPQHDAIVRIHAGRLRRALHRFYQNADNNGVIRISIPKGSYVPFFTNVDDAAADDTVLTSQPEKLMKTGSPGSMLLAIMPFNYFEENKQAVSFAAALTAQLTTELAQLNGVSVISYYAMHSFSNTTTGVTDINRAVGANYVFTGHIQKYKNRLRLNVQLFNTVTSELAWCQVYEKNVSAVSLFDIQNDITKDILSGFSNFSGKRQVSKLRSVAAVA